MSVEAPGVPLVVDAHPSDHPDQVFVSGDALVITDIEDGLEALGAETAAAEIVGTPTRYSSGEVGSLGERLNGQRSTEDLGASVFVSLRESRIMAAGVRLVAERLIAQQAVTGDLVPHYAERRDRFQAMGAIFGAVDRPGGVIELVLHQP